MTPRPLAIACAGAFVTALSTSLVAVSAPVIAKDLAVAPADVSWVLSAYLLAVTSLLAFAGRLGDAFGARRAYTTGFVVFIAGAIACAGAPTLRVLVAARVLQGTGAAMLMAVGPALVTRSVPPAARARSLGIQQATLSVGLTLGPGAGGLLAARFGWHAPFVAIALAGALVLTASRALLPGADPPATRDARTLDVPGAVLVGGGLVLLLLALKQAQGDGWASARVIGLAAGSALAFALFARRTRRHPAPLLPLALLKSPAFALGVLGATLLYTVTFMLAYLLPFQLQRAVGLSASAAGALMTAQPATMALVAPFSGALADRWGPRIPSTAGMVAIAAGTLAVSASATAPLSRTALVASLALVGLGGGLYIAPNSASIMGAAPRELQSTAGAMAATARNLGMTLGIAIAASLDHAVGFQNAVIVAALIATAGAVLGLLRPVAGA